jgi:Cu/Ag efflux protein CusF
VFSLNKAGLAIVSIFLVFAFAGTCFSAGKEASIKMAAGEVKAVDTKAKTISISNNKQAESVFVFDDRTVVRVSNKNSTVDNIKIGDIAALIYDEVSGKSVIKSITVMAPVGAATSQSPEKK